MIFLLMILFIIIASDCYMDIQYAKKTIQRYREAIKFFGEKIALLLISPTMNHCFFTGCIIWIEEMFLSKEDI